MKRERMLEELEQAAEALRIKVIYERLSPEASPGGLCRVQGEYRVMIDRHLPVLERVNVLVGALARFSTEEVYLSPELRERVRKRATELQADLQADRASEQETATDAATATATATATDPPTATATDPATDPATDSAAADDPGARAAAGGDSDPGETKED